MAEARRASQVAPRFPGMENYVQKCMPRATAKAEAKAKAKAKAFLELSKGQKVSLNLSVRTTRAEGKHLSRDSYSVTATGVLAKGSSSNAKKPRSAQIFQGER